MVSSGDINGNSDYAELQENLPAISVNTPDVAGHISKLKQMHEVSAVDLREFSQPREFFT